MVEPDAIVIGDVSGVQVTGELLKELTTTDFDFVLSDMNEENVYLKADNVDFGCIIPLTADFVVEDGSSEHNYTIYFNEEDDNSDMDEWMPPGRNDYDRGAYVNNFEIVEQS